jgi:ribosomal protein S14
MKIKNKILTDISVRLTFKKQESKKQSLKILNRLKLINYLNFLDNFSKINTEGKHVMIKNRCFITSRSSGNYTKFSISRIKLKELAYRSLILGLIKASW